MRPSRPAVVTVVLSLAIVTSGLTASHVAACTCAQPPVPEKLVDRSTLLYVADLEVRSREGNRVHYDARVLEQLVGRPGLVQQLTAVVGGQSSCAAPELPEGRYLVDESSQGIVGGFCGNTRAVALSGEPYLEGIRLALGRPATPPTPPVAAPTAGTFTGVRSPGAAAWLQLLAVVITLGAVTLSAVALLVRRRRRESWL